ncbi:MAG: NAD(P)/FAD-dependent oxidoreductase [Thalassobaculaceae bacterium]|nr:NAD(P)/FAD-dependent oxidoreductase [Thalassobaculaceae bacterium]
MTVEQAVSCDVAIIGAGPAGTVAGALLAAQGFDVVVLERSTFPRFSIGESLLPQSMVVLEEAGMLDAVEAGRFQLKTGAVFHRGPRSAVFDFSDKFSPGWGTALEVQRAPFDKILADEAARQGVEIWYGCDLGEVDFDRDRPRLACTREGGETVLTASFCLDASGFGQVLAKKLNLARPSRYPARESIFTHVGDAFPQGLFDRDKILITVHPTDPGIWYWLIPFSNGTSSIGTVAAKDAYRRYPGDDADILTGVIAEADRLAELMAHATFDRPCQRIVGYSSEVTTLTGANFALLGNAGGFLDPVFSSGVTIALKSASLAASVLGRQLRGHAVDWEQQFVAPMQLGVRTFGAFVSAWYDGRLQDIIFAEDKRIPIQQMICSVLAGYAWDMNNPYVAQPERRLTALAEICRRS